MRELPIPLPQKLTLHLYWFFKLTYMNNFIGNILGYFPKSKFLAATVMTLVQKLQYF